MSPNGSAGKLNRGRLLDVAEAAERLGITQRFVRKLVAQRQLPVYRINSRTIRLSETDLDAYLDSCRNEADSPDPLADQ